MNSKPTLQSELRSSLGNVVRICLKSKKEGRGYSFVVGGLVQSPGFGPYMEKNFIRQGIKKISNDKIDPKTRL